MPGADPRLSALRDIHLPPPISAWPLAVGWWLLAIALIVLVTVSVTWAVRYWLRARAVRAALLKLTALQTRYEQQEAPVEICQELSLLLRQVALAYHQRKTIASLHSEAWVTFLNKTGNTQQFSEFVAILINAPYQKAVSADLAPLFPLCRQWIKRQPHV